MAPIGQVTVFGYFLDFDDQATAAANSSDTFGLRVTGKRPVTAQEFAGAVPIAGRHLD